MYGYNNPYLQSYQPNYQNQQNATQDERIWVSNQQAAESFLVSPSSFVRLWDSSKPVFYEKRADMTGRPMPMEIYEYSRVLPQTATSDDGMDKISIDEINARFEEISSRIEALENKKVTKNAKQSNADDSSI